MERFLLLWCLLLQAVLGQSVSFANYSGSEFEGWKRVVVDVRPPHASGTVGGYRYVVGRQVGRGTWAVDVRLRLRPGEVLTINLAASQPAVFTRGPLPADPAGFFGSPSFAGTPLAVVSVTADGAGWAVHLRSRVGRMLSVDVWSWWAPDQPGWGRAEIAVTASNPTVADMGSPAPAGAMLRFGDADVLIPGLRGETLLQQGEWVADGQSRVWPATLVWRKHLKTPADWSSAGAEASLGLAANGISRLWPGGNPRPPAGSPLEWTIGHWGGAVESLHRWEPHPGVGPNPRSSDTGAQADQVFVGGECQAGTAGLGAEVVRYLVALSMSRRPCHHLEASGDLLALSLHPNLRMWDGRAHWHTGVSPDQLGKPRALLEAETHGWWGPDVEHLLLNNLAVASRLRDSRALQRELGAIARVYLTQWTVAPGLSTSQAYASRAFGWESLAAVLLDEGLEDRVLAAMVVSRWQARWDSILAPATAGSIWDIRVDDPRLGQGEWWIPWQQSVACYGLDLAGRALGRAEARSAALRGARAVVGKAWTLQDQAWVASPTAPVSGFAPRDASFNGFGMPLAPAVVLLHDAGDANSRAIWRQLLAAGGTWLPPEVTAR